MFIRNFYDLDCWKVSYILTLDIYQLTQSFPNYERFGLSSQIRRAAVSVSSNIAEGFSRRTSKEKISFYTIAAGSAREIHCQLFLAKGLDYIQEKEFIPAVQQVERTIQLLYGLIRKLNTRVP